MLEHQEELKKMQELFRKNNFQGIENERIDLNPIVQQELFRKDGFQTLGNENLLLNHMAPQTHLISLFYHNIQILTKF